MAIDLKQYRLLPPNMTPASPYGMSTSSGYAVPRTPPKVSPAPVVRTPMAAPSASSQAAALPKPVATPTTPSVPGTGGSQPKNDFSNDALIGSYMMAQNRGAVPPVSGSSQAEVLAAMTRNLQGLAQGSGSTPAPVNVNHDISSPSAGSQAAAMSQAPAGTTGYRTGTFYDPASRSTVYEESKWDPTQGKYVTKKYNNSTGEEAMPMDDSATAWNARALANFKAGVVDQGDRVDVLRAGLKVPQRSDYSSDEDYQTAVEQYAQDAARETALILQSGAMERSNTMNADRWKTEEERNRERAAEVQIRAVENETRPLRDALIQTLANRGLNVNTDTDAINKLAQFDSDVAKRKSLALQEARGNLTDEYAKRIDAERAAINQRLKDALDVLKTTTEASYKRTQEKALATKSVNDTKKLAIEQAYKEGIIDAKERETKLHELESPSKIGLNEARADQASAMADYTAGAKTEKTVADTAYTEAKTKEVETLLKAKLAKLQAEAKKLNLYRAGGGSGGVGSAQAAEELLGAQALYQSQGGTGTLSGKKLTDAILMYRAQKSLGASILQEGIQAKADYNATTKANSGLGDIISQAIKEANAGK